MKNLEEELEEMWRRILERHCLICGRKATTSIKPCDYDFWVFLVKVKRAVPTCELCREHFLDGWFDPEVLQRIYPEYFKVERMQW